MIPCARAGFEPVYQATVRPVSPTTTGAAAGAFASVSPADRRDKEDAARLFKALAKGHVDGYHSVCRSALGPSAVEGARDPEALKRFLDRAHSLIGKADGNLLGYAARTRPGHGKEAIVALLVRDGIALNVPDRHGHTPVMRLVRDKSDLASLHKLVPHLSKADVNAVNLRDGGRSVLHYAIKAGNLPAVKALVEARVNVNQASMNRSPVTIARKAGHLDIARYLQLRGGREAAALSGLSSRPSWSLRSLDPSSSGESRREPVAREAPRQAEPSVADDYGRWDPQDADCIALLTPESVRHAALVDNA